MNENIDGALRSLAEEINTLQKDKTESNQNKTLEMGRRLIAIRELLRERNGPKPGRQGRPCADGPSPVGWEDWIAANLSISPGTCRSYVGLALNPKRFEVFQRHNRTSTARLRATGEEGFNKLKNNWKRMSPDLKVEVCEWIRQRIIEEKSRAHN